MTTIDDPDDPDDSSQAPTVRIHLLGAPFWINADGKSDVLSKKDAALLAKLALDGTQTKLALYELLWPQAHRSGHRAIEGAASKAAANLRQRVYRLRRETGHDVVELTEKVRLHPLVRVDVRRPAKFIDVRTLLQNEGLLAGFDFGDLDELEGWVGQARLRVLKWKATGLIDLAEALEKQGGRLHEALELAMKAFELMPDSEHAARRVMRIHYLRNDRSAGQAIYWLLAQRMRDNDGLRPSAETQALMQALEALQPVERFHHQPVPVTVQHPPVLIGREPEWRAMAAAWTRAQAILLVGDAGVGKTRLLLKEFLRGLPPVIVEGCQAGDEHQPYSVLGRVLRQADSQFNISVPPSARRELARLQPGGDGASHSPAYEPAIRRAIEQLLIEAVAQGLHAIVLDDLHHVDPASMESIRWLCGRPSLASLRWAMASRPPRDGSHLARLLSEWLADSHRPIRIDLPPLTVAELTDLLASLALPSMIDARIAAQLHAHTGGSPYFVLATVEDALAHGSDLRDGHLPLPSSVHALLESRLKELPDDVQPLLRMAAVAGPDLRADRMATMLGCSVLALSPAWAHLERAGVIVGERFTHALMLEAARRIVSRGVLQALHRAFAAVLAAEPGVAPGRVAWHAERGEAWQDAGRQWFAAGEAARRTGRLPEQTDLFRRSAQCHAAAGDRGAQFEAAFAALESLQLAAGGAAAVEALPAIEALADTSLNRLRCLLARADALLDIVQAAAALDATTAAMTMADLHPAMVAHAAALHAQALAQSGRPRDALPVAEQALAAAKARSNPQHTLRALHALCFVNYAMDRLVEAAAWQRQKIAAAEAIGDRAEAIVGEGHMAALMASIGDVDGTLDSAWRTRQHFLNLGVSENGTFGIVNSIVLGAALAARGRLDQALAILSEAVDMAGPKAAAAAQAKSRITLAGVWLTLGAPERARALMDALPSAVGPGMQMQAALIRARAAQQEGLPPGRFFSALARLAATHRDLPFVQSAWFEASFLPDPTAIVEPLQAALEVCAAHQLHGTVRAFQWRMLVCQVKAQPTNAARRVMRAKAIELLPHVLSMNAKCHPPAVWLGLSKVFELNDDVRRQQACIESARRWLAEASIPAELRVSSFSRNLVHRWILSGDPEGPDVL